MASLEETLSTLSDSSPVNSGSVNPEFIVDENMRLVSVPTAGSIAGVTGDKNVNRVKFKMVKMYDGTNLSTMNIRINYLNAKNEPNYYIVNDVSSSGDYMTFTWLVNSDAVKYEGVVTFCVYAYTLSGSTVTKAFKTANSTLKVLKGLDIESYIPAEEIVSITDQIRDTILGSLTASKDSALEEIESKLSEVVNSIPEGYEDLVAEIKENFVQISATEPTDDYRIWVKASSTGTELELATPSDITEAIQDSVIVTQTLPSVGNPDVFYILTSSGSPVLYRYIENKFAMIGTSNYVGRQLPSTGDAGTNYFIGSGNDYSYYRYINNQFVSLSGDKNAIDAASLAVYLANYYTKTQVDALLQNIEATSKYYISESLPQVSDGDEDTDYYIGDGSAPYMHYRFIVKNEVGAYYPVGFDAKTKSEIERLETKIDANTSSITSYSTKFEEYDDAIEELEGMIPDLSTGLDMVYYGSDAAEDALKNKLILQEVKARDESGNPTEVNTIAAVTITGGGGGGGGTGSVSTTITLKNVGSSSIVISPTDKAEFKFEYKSLDGDGNGVGGSYVVTGTSGTVAQGNVESGKTYTVDLTNFVSVGTTQKFRLTVTDDAYNAKTLIWSVQKVDIRLESSFSDRTAVGLNKPASFTYIPYGANVEKTIYFKLDGRLLGSVKTVSSGIAASYTLPAQSHGAHFLDVWMEAVINGRTITTAHIYKDIVWYNDQATRPVIGCQYRFDYRGEVKAKQYDSTSISYTVFDPSTTTPTVERYVDGKLIATDVLTSSVNEWNYRTDVVASHTLKIKCGTTSVTIVVNVQNIGYDVTPVTANLLIDFNPSGIKNTSSNRLPTWTGTTGTIYSLAVSDNFDWTNGGYRTDSDGNDYFVVKAGSRAYINNYYMFPAKETDGPAANGAEMKLVFMTENVANASATWFTNVETVNGISKGIQLNAHEGWFKTNNASSEDIEEGEGTDAIAASNTYLYFPYSEEDIIELDINFEPIYVDGVKGSRAFVMSYEDGVPSKAFVYGPSDELMQRINPQKITIGSDDLDVRIYRMKIYETALTTENVLRNFISDARSSQEMVDRYRRNSIYYNSNNDTYYPYASMGVLSPERLAQACPNLRVLMLSAPTFTTGKKNHIKNSSLRCIYVNGDAVLDNWIFENGYHSGQGTTSDNYGISGRNIDFLFNSDGVHNAVGSSSTYKKDEELDQMYKSTLTTGLDPLRLDKSYNTAVQGNAYTTANGNNVNDPARVTLTRTSIPNNYFNMKVNIASSENANNALFQKRYNDFLPYVSPAKQRDSRIKNDMEFVPAVLFIRETDTEMDASGNYINHSEFKDTEWHFYAIGNIGDSKKTDYTRAYDPNDMNEFVIEISDNTMNNSTFQSGIFYKNGMRAKETFTLDASGTAISVDKPMDYIYPISLSEWEDENNMRHWTLYNEKFDGDHSFEPRYACCGDYRDGKFTDGMDKTTYGQTTGCRTKSSDSVQLKKNEDVWRAFYRWVVTASDSQFVNELDEWCVRSAVEFFYAYTHIWTMMDNRAKNTFWHYAKTGTHREVSNPVKELLHVYTHLVDGQHVPCTETEISVSSHGKYYTEYAFDLWDYDNDTSVGINNNGELVFPYGKEDSDYNTDGLAESGYIFNGARSAFWCRLRDLLGDEIKERYVQANMNCWSAEHLINEFDSFQESFPEELWRLDIERKYIRTYTGNSVDNSIGGIKKTDASYLRDMMQGKKKYQRRQWVRDQQIYFDSKYDKSDRDSTDRLSFRASTPSGNPVVKPNYNVKLIPYRDMYIRVRWGGTSGALRTVRAKAGQQYTLNSPGFNNADDTQIIIYDGRSIQELSDLSAMYVRTANFSQGVKLKKIVLGNPTTGYANNFFDGSISLCGSDGGSTIGLLEELDVRNMNGYTGSIDLSKYVNFKKLYAEGTRATSITFAENGKVELAHLPNTVTRLTMVGLAALTEEGFEGELDKLIYLWIEGGNLDILEFVENNINTLQEIKLRGVNWEVEDASFIDKLADMPVSDITGTINMTGNVRPASLSKWQSTWDPEKLTITYNPDYIIQQSKVTFVNYNGTVLYEMYVDNYTAPTDPVATGLISAPTKPTDDRYVYTFSKWDWSNTSSGDPDAIGVVSEPTTITPIFTTSNVTYTVRWYESQNGRLLKTVNGIEWGEEVVYDFDTEGIPTNKANESTGRFTLFTGWDKSTGCVKSNIDVYGQWASAMFSNAAFNKPLDQYSPIELYALAYQYENGKVTIPSTTLNKINTKDHVDIVLGDSGEYSNVESQTLVEVGEDRLFNGEAAGVTVYDDIIPFESGKSFTLAIDYEFLYENGSGVNGALLSIYDPEDASGLRLYMDSRYGSTVAYSSSTEVKTQKCSLVDSVYNDSAYRTSLRNILVIRHEANSNVIKMYTSTSSTNADIPDSIITYTIRATNSGVSNGKLTLGGVSKLSNRGRGVIHWAKIWMDDIGEQNAKNIAIWPREKIRMEYVGPEASKTLSSNNADSSIKGLSFMSNAALTDTVRKMNEVANYNNATPKRGTWIDSDLRTFMNDRLLKAFPIVWRGIIKKSAVYTGVNRSNNDGSSAIWTEEVSHDFLYIPSVTEINSATQYYPGDGDGKAVPWITNVFARAKYNGVLVTNDFSNSDTVGDKRVSTYSMASEPSAQGNDIYEGDMWANTWASYYESIMLAMSDENFRKRGEQYWNATTVSENAHGKLKWVKARQYILRTATLRRTENDISYFLFGILYYMSSVASAWETTSYSILPCFTI